MNMKTEIFNTLLLISNDLLSKPIIKSMYAATSSLIKGDSIMQLLNK